MSTSPATTVATHDPQRPSRHEWGASMSGIEQQVDQGLAARPAQPVAVTVKVDLNVCDF